MQLEQRANGSYRTVVCGTSFTIEPHRGGWRVAVENACTRAWRSFPSNDFDTLAAVEQKYRSLRGIAALLEAEVMASVQ